MFRFICHLFRKPVEKASVPVSAPRQRIRPEIRNAVWIKYHGEQSHGQCYCCGNVIYRQNKQSPWHCSHVKAHIIGGEESVDNLRTCCQHCNLSMGDQNLYAYIRDRNLTGPGSKNLHKYLKKHRSQRMSRRTNNFGRTSKTRKR
jgi:5-methylcytosine-specific restriction endonuclease McrA